MRDGLCGAQPGLLAQETPILSYLLSAGECLDLLARNFSAHMKAAKVRTLHDDIIHALTRLGARSLHLSPARFILGDWDLDD